MYINKDSSTAEDIQQNRTEYHIDTYLIVPNVCVQSSDEHQTAVEQITNSLSVRFDTRTAVVREALTSITWSV
mgnify:CR=1